MTTDQEVRGSTPLGRAFINGKWLSLVEHLVWDQGVAGSNPVFPILVWGLSSAGRAPALHAGGQRFDPARLHFIYYMSRRYTQVRLKGSVLKTDRRRESRGGSNPSTSSIFKFYIVAGWSSTVARRAHNPKVAGSNPVPATKMVPWCSG